jgi:uncharacterized protein (DUF433 family)
MPYPHRSRPRISAGVAREARFRQRMAVSSRQMARTAYFESRAGGVLACDASDCAPGADAVKFTRITTDPRQMGGLPCIRGLRIPVATVVAMIADGMSEAEILSAYPDLERDDVREALRYAADAVRERELPLIQP